MRITIASGKGGTGKTTIAVNLAMAAYEEDRDLCLIDADVEEPNCHVFLQEDFEGEEEVSIPVPFIDGERCNNCGLCSDFCAFNALACVGKEVVLFPELCHGCGACWLICPEGAIKEQPRGIGKLQWSLTKGIPFVRGILNVGEPMAPPVISAALEKAPKVGLRIVDGPPGTSCSMVETSRGSDLLCLVAEPTPFGLNDLRLAVEVARELSIPLAVVINKADDNERDIEEFCSSRAIPVVARFPWRREAAEVYARGGLLYGKQEGAKEEYKKLLKVLTERTWE